MRLRNITIALVTVFGLLGAIAFFGFPQEPAPVQSKTVAVTVAASAEPEPVFFDEPAQEKSYTRLDEGNLVLIKQKSPNSTLEEVVDLFEDGAPVIIAKCYSVEACLQARQIMEPLAHDEVVQEAFYTVIIEAFDSNQPSKIGDAGIVYMFAMPKCGMDMGAREYTSTGLFAAAVSYYRNVTKTCQENK